MKIETCCACEDATGRAGVADDSLYTDDGNGPFCETCWKAVEYLQSRAALSRQSEAQSAPGAGAVANRIRVLEDALRFYADGRHFYMHDSSAWDTVSGEPMNFYEDESNTATVEDGTVAKQALAGTPLADDEERQVQISAPIAAQEPVAIVKAKLADHTMTWLMDRPLPVGTKLYAAPQAGSELPETDWKLECTIAQSAIKAHQRVHDVHKAYIAELEARLAAARQAPQPQQGVAADGDGEFYQNGPEGMPRVKRMSDSTIDWSIDGVDIGGMLTGERAYHQLRQCAHAIAEEVLARVPSWPAPQAVAAPDRDAVLVKVGAVCIAQDESRTPSFTWPGPQLAAGWHELFVKSTATQPSAAPADPCPQCIPGAVCKTPTCGRLQLLAADEKGGE